jgi:D-amino-acid dehydrogenase
MSPKPEVIVVGAGVVGLSAALALQMRGLSVMVVDREGPAAGASAGNAGALAFSDILPLASPGMLWKAPKWLLDPLGPLTVPPAYALKIAPWMLRFSRACSPAQVRRSTVAQTALMDLARAELEPFLAATGTASMLRKEGNLQVYETEAEFRAALPGWQVRIDHGIEVIHMDRAQIDALQPGLSPRFQHGTFTPGWQSVTDPKDFTLALADRFRANGGTLAMSQVVALTPAGEGVTLTLASGETLATAHVVLAAGAHSHHLARGLGDRVPLETERGYNTTLPGDAFDIRTQVTFGGHGFVVTRLTSGIRVGGAVELGGLSLPPNFARAEAMLKKAQTFLPGLKTTGGTQWMGFRPSLPDTLPAIGHARATRRVTYAFGHGHLGLTQSAATARLVADLVTGAPPPIDITPFSPQRF